MKKILLFLLILGNAHFATAQNSTIEKAERAYDAGKYAAAVPLYEKALKANFDPFTAFELAECYIGMGDHDKATAMFEKLISDYREDLPLVRYDYAVVLKQMGKYEQAVSAFDTFIEEAKTIRGRIKGDAKTLIIKAEEEVKGCELALNDPYQPSENDGFRLATEFPTSKKYFAGTYLPQQKQLWLASVERTGRGAFERFTQNSDTQQWEPYLNTTDGMKNLTSTNQEESAIISPDGNTLYFVRSSLNYPAQLYFSTRKNGRWGRAQVLEDRVNDPYFDNITPALSATGDTLYFSSDRPHGKGGFDIWYSVKNSKGEWKKAINFEEVNSSSDELAPVFDHRTNTMYFTSDGHSNYGGYDIFKYDASRNEVVNLGAPFNTHADDGYLVLTDHQMLWSSKRGQNDYQVYEQTIDQAAVVAQSTIDKIQQINSDQQKLSFNTNLDAKASTEVLTASVSVAAPEESKAPTAPKAPKALNYEEKEKQAEHYYADLEHQQKNKVERIIAVMWLNMYLTLAPELKAKLNEDYHALNQEQKKTIKTLGRYYYAKSFTQRATLAQKEYNFCKENTDKTADQWRRIIIYRAFRHDKEGMAKMSQLDWEYLKSRPEEEVNQMKFIAKNLRSTDKVKVKSKSESSK